MDDPQPVNDRAIVPYYKAKDEEMSEHGSNEELSIVPYSVADVSAITNNSLVCFRGDAEHQQRAIVQGSNSSNSSGRKRRNPKKQSAISQLLLALFCTLTLLVVAVGVILYLLLYFNNGSFTPGTPTTADGLDGPPVSPIFPPSTNATHPPAPTNMVNPGAPNVAPVVMTPAPVSPPTDAPTTSPTGAPSTSYPTATPTPNQFLLLAKFLQNNYNVVFPDDTDAPAYLAVEWLLAEATGMASELLLGPKLAQRFSLITLDFELNVPNETKRIVTQMNNWDFNWGVADVDECDWKGITCENDTVTSLEFGNLQLGGTIPPEIGILQNVTFLDLSQNQLSGPIPEELYEMTRLDHLYLFKNALTGTLSSRLGNMNNLTHLHLSHNQLSGSIPTTIASGDFIKPFRKYLFLHRSPVDFRFNTHRHRHLSLPQTPSTCTQTN
jgi:hypothetical protein